MAFRLKIDEPIEKGFRRIGLEQIERARRQLSANADPASEVHEARKCTKRIRALLRLARTGLGENVFRAENAHFRSIASSMASARDDHVLLETIIKLEAEDTLHAGPALARLKHVLFARRDAASADRNGSVDRTEADAALERAQRRFRRLHIDPDSFATLEQGLVRNYRKSLERRDVAYMEGTDDAFHEWRKCVQAHWRHMALLSKAWPALFEVHIEAARELSQVLGDDHDLALLRLRLAALPPDALWAEDANAIETMIRTRQQALRRSARPMGDMIFAERPKAHGRRIAAVWHGAAARNREQAGSREAAPEKHPRVRAAAHVRS